jgi:dihydrofolate synthase/folylpolyglutamate synthase
MIGATIADRLPSGARIPVILGIVAGKDIEGIARALMSIASLVIVSQPGRFKPGDPEDVARRVTAAGLTVEMERDPQTALARARALRDAARTPASPTSPAGAPILVTGSFYMVAEIRRLLVSELATPGTEPRDVTQ